MIIVLMITAFYFSSTNRPPEAAAMVVPSVEACRTLGERLKTALIGTGKVEDAEFACLGVKPGKVA